LDHRAGGKTNHKPAQDKGKTSVGKNRVENSGETKGAQKTSLRDWVGGDRETKKTMRRENEDFKKKQLEGRGIGTRVQVKTTDRLR